jgi:hypothetical protein
MSEKNVHKLYRSETLHCDKQSELKLIVFSSSDNTYHPFHVDAQMTVEAFLELALTKLSEGTGAGRVAALKRYYQPVLEVQERSGDRELPPALSLADAGLGNESVCRIAAHPLKERLMFCSYG